MDKDKTLEVKVRRVWEAASKCPDAKRTLETLFPEAFGEEVQLIVGDVYRIRGVSYILTYMNKSYALVDIYTGGSYNGVQCTRSYAFGGSLKEGEVIHLGHARDIIKLGPNLNMNQDCTW